MTVGILAFGSIADEPGPELEAAVARRIEVVTPFRVEFARSSRTRDGAPTLVPVSAGGSPQPGAVLVLDDSVSESTARELLYRRESGRIGNGARASWIAALPSFAGLQTCLYTALPPNIEPLSADRLAELALHSAAALAGARRRDGISYLEQQERRGVMTPLTPAYLAAILARTGARDLGEAWRAARARAAA